MISSIIFYKLFGEKYDVSIKLILTILLINVISYFSFNFVDYFVISLLIIASIVDIKTRIIPNVIPLVILILSLKPKIPQINYFDVFVIILISILFTISLLSDSIGMGDIKLFISLYLLNGSIWFNKFLFILSALMFIFSILLLIKNRSYKISFPLVPLILLSYILSRSFI